MKKIINYFSLILLIILTLKTTFSDFQDRTIDCSGYYPGYGMMGYGNGFGYVYFLLFFGILISLIVFGFKYFNENKMSQNRASQNKEDFLEILKKRLASGEITEDEYDAKKKKLIEK